MYFKRLLLLSALASISTVFASGVKNDENVLFIPDIAYQTHDGKLAVNVQAWVYEKERRVGMTTLAAFLLGIKKDELTKEEYARLYERSQLFRVDSERNKILTIELSDKTVYTLPKTDRGGLTKTTIYPVINEVPQKNSIITYQLDKYEKPQSANIGEAIFLPETGVSVISDIDDTIKDSNVLDKKALLVNTFIKPFKAIDNMRDWYQEMANNEIAFHYVSSSPIQLYPALKEFMDSAKFPHGTFHLREGTTWNSIIPVNDASYKHKKASVTKLLTAYPKREFILIGDSGEADPEIYVEILRDYPSQIKMIAIRNVTNEDENSARFQNLFKNIPKNKWHIFTDPKTID